MCRDDFSDYGAWLARFGDRFIVAGLQRDGDVSTGGWMAIKEANDNPHLDTDPRWWKEEALAGMDSKGNETKIENAVIPKSGREYSSRESAEDRAIRSGRRFIEQPNEPEVRSENKVKKCPRCKTKEIFRKTKNQSYCNACIRIMKREKRSEPND